MFAQGSQGVHNHWHIAPEIPVLVSFPSLFEQPVNERGFAVEVLGRQIRGGGSVDVRLKLINWRGVGLIRSNVMRSTNGPCWMTTVRADKSRALYGPSLTCVSLDFSSPDGSETASDGS